MTKSNPTRSDDMHALEILHVIETQGTAAARAQFGISNSAVQGMRHRMLNPRNLPGCACERPENRDGGMPPRWWAA